MRDWLKTDDKDRECLKAARHAEALGHGAWRPWSGMFARARRLAKNGLLKKAGTSAMPPHVVYVLTNAGCEELQVAETLSNIKQEDRK